MITISYSAPADCRSMRTVTHKGTRNRKHNVTHNGTHTVRRVLALTLLVLGSSAMLSACSSGADAQKAAAPESTVPVRVVSLAQQVAPSASIINVTGTLAGKEEVALAFKIGGVISRVVVDAGQSVRAGQVLAELRPTEIAAQVATAQQARQKAERDLERVTKLYADSVTTLEQLQDARTALEVATNNTRIAQFNADYAVIRAPGDGIVLARMAEPGQVVEPGRPVLNVRRNGRGMVVRIGVSDRDAVRVRLGDSAEITFEALPTQKFAGRVTQRAAAATAGSGDYGVQITLADAANALPSGLVARVVLRPHGAAASGTTQRVTVPLDALVDADADSAAVFVIRADGNSVARRTVKLTDVAGALLTAQVPVVSGLDGSERVVVAGMSRLIDGTRVRIVAEKIALARADSAPVWRAAP